MKDRALKRISIAVALLFAVMFLAVFGKAAILRAYIDIGVGSCRKIPILCKAPEKEIINPAMDKKALGETLPHNFGDIAISLPKGFSVVKGEMRKVYYKKWRLADKGGIVYLLRQDPDFFIGLFPQLKKQGVKDDYEFVSRIMSARSGKIAGLSDAFFVIMKSIFTPDLGDQRSVAMVKFTSGQNKGFINYNLTPRGNYFDCNIISSQGDFFKIYIKDPGATLDLDKLFAIISTVNKP